MNKKAFRWISALAGLISTSISLVALADGPDTLFVSDHGANTVERFDAKTGAQLGALVNAPNGGLVGPNGIVIVKPGEAWVANQNVNLPFNGDVRRYDLTNGDFISSLVSSNDPNGPLAPDGLVLYAHKTLFVTDVGDFDGINETPGKILAYDAANGSFLNNLTPVGYLPVLHARGVVIGPDKKLYVSTRNLTSPLGGDVLMFDPESFEYLGVFISSATCNCDLNRPDGLVFGSNGRLYVTSFRADANDNDKILVFSGKTGKYLDKIELDEVGKDRAFAQALLFGPEGKLYVPISGNGPETGSIRAYDVKTKKFRNLVPPGTMQAPVYLSFGKTDPGTLKYRD